MKITRAVKSGLFVLVVGLFILPLAGQNARADNVDFSCNPGNCTGIVTNSGGNLSSTGISVFNDSGPYSSSDAFNLAFSTMDKTISLTGTGAEAGQVLKGTINNVMGPMSGGSASALGVLATWWGLPTVVQDFLGTPTGVGSSFLIYLTGTGAASLVDVFATPTPATPTPEPGTLLLLGTGMLFCAALLRRKYKQGELA